METGEDQAAMEQMAFLCWPFNTTTNGFWKDECGMTDDMRIWKDERDKDREFNATESKGENLSP
jgi:hypothetical protein